MDLNTHGTINSPPTLTSLYRVKKDFLENIELGPDFNGKLPVIIRAPKNQWVDFLGYKIASRLGVPACAITTSKGIWLASRLGFDVLTYKSIRCQAHTGHPKPNITYINRTEQLTYQDIGRSITTRTQPFTNPEHSAIANSFGNGSMDIDWVKCDIQQAKKSLLEGQILIVSIFGETLDEWITTALIAQDAGADIIEANFSCPNLGTHNEPIYINPKNIFSIAHALVQTVLHVPLILKFGIFTDTQLMKHAFIAAAQAGARGICGINSVPMKVINADGTTSFGTRTMAGVSGNPIRELALDFVRNASIIIQKEHLNLELLGVGGITMARHFTTFFAAGAAIALSATGMMWNPYLAAQYNQSCAQKEKLATRLFDIGAIKFGDFTLKSGLHSPIYVDMRTTISYPDVLKELASCLKNIAQTCNPDLLCGVPYGAVPVTTALSIHIGKPMIMVRKETKDHGTKNSIEGVYTTQQECLVVEDVITSGASILETIKTLESAGLRVNDVAVLLNREQGGQEALENQGYRLHAVFTLQELLASLKKYNKITQETLNTLSTLDKTQASCKKNHSLSFKQRAAYCTNPIAQQLLTIIDAKKTNLVFAADVTSKTKLLQLADLIGPEICILKIHCDIINDYDQEIPKQLRALAKKHNFLIWEDRKFADIGATSTMQYTGGFFRIADWADIITVHAIAGDGTLEALRSTPATKNSAFLLIAEMSSAKTLTQESYIQATTQLALQYPDNVIGLICRKKLSDNPALLHLTPGVQLAEGTDAFGQQYLTPEKVINENQSDIIIVGRGILQAQDPLAQAQLYKNAGWNAYQKRVPSFS